MAHWFNRHLKPLWNPTSRFLSRVERGELRKILPRERHAGFQNFLVRTAMTPRINHVVLRFDSRYEAEDAYGWLSFELHRERDSASLRLDGMYLPSGPENRLTVPDDLENVPVFDIGRVL
jgi:hypothetical protein